MNTVPAIFLGCVARHIRHIQCIVNGLSDSNGHDADAHAYREAPGTPVELEAIDACPDLPGKLKHVVQMGVAITTLINSPDIFSPQEELLVNQIRAEQYRPIQAKPASTMPILLSKPRCASNHDGLCVSSWTVAGVPSNPCPARVARMIAASSLTVSLPSGKPSRRAGVHPDPSPHGARCAPSRQAMSPASAPGHARFGPVISSFDQFCRKILYQSWFPQWKIVKTPVYRDAMWCKKRFRPFSISHP